MSSSNITKVSGSRISPAHGVMQRDIVFSFAAGDTSEEQALINDFDDLLKKVIVVVGSASGAVVTTAFTIKDKDDNTILSDSGLTEGSENQYSVEEPLYGTVKIGITPSTDPLSDLTVTVHLKGV